MGASGKGRGSMVNVGWHVEGGGGRGGCGGLGFELHVHIFFFDGIALSCNACVNNLRRDLERRFFNTALSL